ncbi:hypothetical protein HYALB_00002493 [Hymenoscyphus albidus]|uniref:MARVEL domain-containing protein n=1 Tax=Hymenoscyphus albidus TaxID=595503 RepID=A0A9N9Q9E8_9HELO|nr:hypothetical protein HYALB_00002493 [Hymenoscyphus albidus]
MLHRNVRGGQPSPYPRWPFHGLRAAQLFSSITVSSIMTYFMHFLHAAKFQIPWTFIVLLAVSVATVISLAITIFLYNFRFLSPRYNMLTNGAISLGWAMGFGMLSWSISTSNVLGKTCSKKVWNDSDAAVSVCRDYKALWAMTLIGTIATLAALALDIRTWNKTYSRGKYALPEDDKEARKLKDLSMATGSERKYETLRKPGTAVNSAGSVMPFQHEEMDIGYHTGYGQEVEPHGPLMR